MIHIYIYTDIFPKNPFSITIEQNFFYFECRLEQEKGKGTNLTQKTKLKDILTKNFQSPKENIKKKHILSKNINIFHSPKIFKTIMEDIKSQNSKKNGSKTSKLFEKQQSIEIINFNLKDLASNVREQKTEKIDSAENIKIPAKNDNAENKKINLKIEMRKLNETLLENNFERKNSENETVKLNEKILINRFSENKKLPSKVNANKINNFSNFYEKQANAKIKNDTVLNDSKFSKIKSYSYDFSRKYSRKALESDNNQTQENQHRKKGKEIKSYQQLSSLLKTSNFFKTREKSAKKMNERSNLKEVDMNANVINCLLLINYFFFRIKVF
jgi:hypothetical protein